MGMRCELFGHEFGDSKIEESYDEDERGTVLTVREYRSCQRCGHIRHISENRGLISDIAESKTNDGRSNNVEYRAETERQVRRRENAEGETEATDTGQTAAETESTDAPESTADAPDAVADPSSDTEVSDASAAVATSTPPERTDDAVILSEPATQEPDDGDSTPPNSDDAVIIDDTSDTVHPSSETSKRSGSGNDQDQSLQTADDVESTTTDPDPTYRCPRCEFELPVSESSYFPGDVCPQCRVGYLEDISDSES